VPATPTESRQPLTLWLSEDLPSSLIETLEGWAANQPGEVSQIRTGAADVGVGWEQRPGSSAVAQVFLVPAVRFPSPRQSVSSDELRRAWLGQPRSTDTVGQLVVSAETAAALDGLIGLRSAEKPPTIVAASELADTVWSEPDAVAVVPFDELQPRLKALPVDGLDVLDRSLDLRRYPLVATVWAVGPKQIAQAIAGTIKSQGMDTNRHPDRLTVLAMTGVTALTRHLAMDMDQAGDSAWPARHIASLLAAADLTHVSNEVSFMPGCQPEAEMTAFCARPEYMETLRLIGTDVVELTGNHNLDFGPDYALQSLEMYAQEGMRTFGGGQDAEQARRPLLITSNGSRLAFLGYNQFGPGYAWATATSPGAAPFSQGLVQEDVAAIRAEADVVLVNIQYTETYETVPLPEQQADFRAAIEAGADVVTGSQAHQPQAIEFYNGGLIFYGLGNLFFDQTWSAETSTSLVVFHTIYDGRLIATRLLPTITTPDLQTWPASQDEGQQILQSVFDASGW
jgi:hypothetical protein